MVGRIFPPPLGGDRVRVSENLGATAFVLVGRLPLWIHPWYLDLLYTRNPASRASYRALWVLYSDLGGRSLYLSYLRF